MAPYCQVELFSDAINYVVLRTEGRNFPGMVIQGDSLRGIYELARRIRQETAGIANEALRDDAEELEERLRDRLLHYQATLDAAGISLPYPRRIPTEPDQQKTQD